MKILGITGSYRKKGNTDLLVLKVLEGLAGEGLETQYLFLSDYDFKDCRGCEGCRRTFKCVLKDDMQKIYPLLAEADGLVIGSPTYFYNVTGQMKCFLNRMYCQEIFDDEDRSIWMPVNEVTGYKYAVTVAVCEQNNEADMGFTSLTMSQTLEAMGYRVVENIKALKVFEKGDILKEEGQLNQAFRAGVKLAKTLKLREHIKRTTAA